MQRPVRHTESRAPGFLAAARAYRWAVPARDTVIRRASQWLLDWIAAGTYGWPASISGAELDAGAARLTRVPLLACAARFS